MQRAASKSRFLINLSLKQRFVDSESLVGIDNSLQGIVLSRLTRSANSHQLFDELANTFIRLAENAYSLRDTKRLEEASRVLMVLPLAKARPIGLFYQALTLKRTGQIDEAQKLFELIANNGPLSHRARAFQALGALHFDKGQPAEALRFHLEAARRASNEVDQNPLDKLMVQLEISHIQAHAGDHQRALAGLESLAPLVRFVAKEHPFYRYVYHNALAVEFGDLNRIAEAEAALSIALASPYAAAYPEWSETRDEIASKRQAASPSVVAIHRATEATPTPKAESQRKPKLVTGLAFSWQPGDKDFFQRSRIPIPRSTTIALHAVNILDLVLTGIGPRAPPGALLIQHKQ